MKIIMLGFAIVVRLAVRPSIHLLIHPFFLSCERRLIFCAWLVNRGITKGICHSVASGINLYELYLNSYGSHGTYFG